MQQMKAPLILAMLAFAPMFAFAQTPGATLPTTDERIDQLQQRLDALDSQMNNPESVVQTSVADLNKLKVIKISGYAQIRLENDQAATNNAVAGDQRFSFKERRVRLKVAASPTDSTQIVYQFDMGDKGFVTKDAYISFNPKGNVLLSPTFTLGQFAVPFGYQNTQSSSAVETGERARIIREMFPDEYDRGLMLSSKAVGRMRWDLALLNGNLQNNIDNTSNKDGVGRLRYSVTPALDLGVSAYRGGKFFVAGSGSTPGTTYHDKDRTGVDFQAYAYNLTVKGEYITGKDKGVDKSGYYLLASRNISTRDDLDVMYDVFTVPTETSTTWTLGANHYLDAATKLRLFYTMTDEKNVSVKNNTVRLELLSKF